MSLLHSLPWRQCLLQRSPLPLLGAASNPVRLSSRFEAASRASSPLPPTADPDALRQWVDELREKDKKRLIRVLAGDLNLKLAADDSDAEDSEVLELNFGVLSQLSFFHALPFVGFGFLDNLIMIVAGEYIDHTLGITLGISTMAAAGLGNALSDVFGIGSAWYVEHWVARLGVRAPDISAEQAESTRARVASNVGRALGVVVGCLIGMFPLLFIDTETKPNSETSTDSTAKLEAQAPTASP